VVAGAVRAQQASASHQQPEHLPAAPPQQQPEQPLDPLDVVLDRFRNHPMREQLVTLLGDLPEHQQTLARLLLSAASPAQELRTLCQAQPAARRVMLNCAALQQHQAGQGAGDQGLQGPVPAPQQQHPQPPRQPAQPHRAQPQQPVRPQQHWAQPSRPPARAQAPAAAAQPWVQDAPLDGIMDFGDTEQAAQQLPRSSGCMQLVTDPDLPVLEGRHAGTALCRTYPGSALVQQSGANALCFLRSFATSLAMAGMQLPSNWWPNEQVGRPCHVSTRPQLVPHALRQQCMQQPHQIMARVALPAGETTWQPRQRLPAAAMCSGSSSAQ